MLRPDFLILPYALLTDDGLRPTDGHVYAILYWLERLRDGRCIAGNGTIAELALVEERTVRAALDRLERKGYIQRVYADKERKMRVEIRTLVMFAKVPPQVMAAPMQTALVQSEEKPQTPGEVAKSFFNPEDKMRHTILDEIIAQTGANRNAVVMELKKFIAYWTEPNKTGTKQRWQLQQTFDVRRRIATWLSNAHVRGTTTARSGAGATI